MLEDLVGRLESTSEGFLTRSRPCVCWTFPVSRKRSLASTRSTQQSFFESTEESYLSELKEAADESGVTLAGMAVDQTGDPSFTR